MFGFLTPVRTEATDPLTDLVAVEAFWRSLPKNDPIAAQKAVCAALADPMARGVPSIDRLRALLALDQRARSLVEALLLDLAVGNSLSASRGPQSWQAAFELCRSLGRAHGQFLRSMHDSPGHRGCRQYQPYVVLRLFQHRQIELLLRPFADEGPTRFSWKELHEAYRFAQSRELLHHEVPIQRCHSPCVVDTTLEHEYIQVLLQDLMNGGHFPPHDAFWVSQRIPRWSRALALEAPRARRAEQQFVVDPDGDAGLARLNGESAGTCLGLDTTSLLTSIREEIESLRDVPGRPGPGSSLRRGRQLNLLRKLTVLCAPERPVIARRGEREPTALTVEVVVGLAQIVRELRDKPQDGVVAAPRTVAMGEDGANTAFGGGTEAPTDASLGDGSTVTQWSTSAAGAAHPRLTMVDRSDSGCRLHGPSLAANPIVPGVLIAFRNDAATPWTLAVVRRTKKRLAGKRIEIGVEYLGNDPRRIIVVVPDSEANSARLSGSATSRFAALFLPESKTPPVLPIKTLVLPACGLVPEDRLSVRSRTDVYAIQLKEPLEEQADFIWSPFEILERWQKDDPAFAEAMSEAR